MSLEKKPLQLGGLVKTKNNTASSKKENDKSDLIAITVKLDKKRYKALKMHALDAGKTSQKVMVEALDLLLSK